MFLSALLAAQHGGAGAGSVPVQHAGLPPPAPWLGAPSDMVMSGVSIIFGVKAAQRGAACGVAVRVSRCPGDNIQSLALV